MTEKSAPKGNTATFCTCSEILATSSGRPTGTFSCPLSAASEAAGETSGARSATASGHGGGGDTAGAQNNGNGPKADEPTTREAGAPTGTERTDGHPDRDTGTGGRKDVGAEAGAETESSSGREMEAETNIETEVKRRNDLKTRTPTERQSREAQAEKGKGRNEVETEAPRNQIRVKPTQQTPGAVTNTLKKPRRAKRNRRRKAVLQMYRLHLESQKTRGNRRKSREMFPETRTNRNVSAQRRRANKQKPGATRQKTETFILLNSSTD